MQHTDLLVDQGWLCGNNSSLGAKTEIRGPFDHCAESKSFVFCLLLCYEARI